MDHPEFLIVFCLAGAPGLGQAASAKSTLEVSMTVVESCEIHARGTETQVDCPPGVTWRVTTVDARRIEPPGTAQPAGLRAPAGRAGIRVTTVVF